MDDADAVATRTRYAALRRKTRALHEAKVAMSRQAERKAEREGRGEDELDALRRETRALETGRDAAMRELDAEEEEELAAIDLEARVVAESGDDLKSWAMRRHLEEERAKAEDESTEKERRTAAPIPMRPQVTTREEDEYVDADDYRTQSPEGTSPRATSAVGDESEDEEEKEIVSVNVAATTAAAAAENAREAKDEDVSALKKVMGIMQRKADRKASQAQQTDRFEVKRGNATMAALAPAPVPPTVVEERVATPLVATPSFEENVASASATPVVPMMDPHDALLQKLKSTSVRGQPPARQSMSAEAPASTQSSNRRPQAAALTEREKQDPFAPPRGLAAAIDAIASRRQPAAPPQTIESAFGMPRFQNEPASAPASIFQQRQGGTARDSVFAPDAPSERPPAAPVRVEPNPYLLSEEDTRPAPRRRFGLPRGREQKEDVVSKGGRDAGHTKAIGFTDAIPSARRDMALTPSNQQVSLANQQDVDSDSSPNAVNLKPKIPRALVPRIDFKISEVRSLFSFARHGRYGELKKLIMKGVPIDARDEMGNSALIVACQNGQGRCVKLLVRSGADPNLQNKQGNTALHFSVHFRFDAVSDFLQRHGGLTNIQNAHGQTCFEFVG
jgi:hypothetical protein